MAFLVERPMVVRKPIWKYTSLGIPRSELATMAPNTPSGSMSRLTKGIVQLSYSAATQRKMTKMEKA